MLRAKISIIDKMRIYDSFKSGHDHFLLAHQLGIKKNTTRKFILSAERRGVEICPVRGEAHNVKVDDEMKVFIKNMVDTNWTRRSNNSQEQRI